MANETSLQDLLSIVEVKMDSQLLQKASTEIAGQNRIAELERDFRTLATQGSIEARHFIKSRVTFLLLSLKEIINPGSIDKLIGQYQVNYFENIYSDKEKFEPGNINFEIREYFNRFSIDYEDSFDVKLDKLTQICYQELFGYSILDELIFDSNLNEVACNRYDYIWIQYKGIKRKIPNKSFTFSSKERYELIIENRITSTARNEMNSGEPITYSVLENGSRVTALRPPLSRYYIISIRLFNTSGEGEKDKPSWTLHTAFKLDGVSNDITGNKIFDFLRIMVRKGRRNIAIIGEQGSGKTTVADKIIISSMEDELSIGLAENVHELDISRKYKNKNIIELQYGKNFTPTDVMEMFFRLNRDVVIFGEVRNHFEAFEMLKAMLRQARGSLFTFHSSSIRRMIHDLRQLLVQTGYYRDYQEAQFDVADAVDIIIHVKLDRRTGDRYIFKVSELIALEETMSYRINELFSFSKEEGVFYINKNGIDKSTLDDCMSYELDAADISAIREIFTVKSSEQDLYRYQIQDFERDLFNVYEN